MRSKRLSGVSGCYAPSVCVYVPLSESPSQNLCPMLPCLSRSLTLSTNTQHTAYTSLLFHTHTLPPRSLPPLFRQTCKQTGVHASENMTSTCCKTRSRMAPSPLSSALAPSTQYVRASSFSFCVNTSTGLLLPACCFGSLFPSSRTRNVILACVTCVCSCELERARRHRRP